jgi:hypothetical protein
MVSLFLSTALVISSAGCGPQQQVVYDQDGNPITVEEDDDDDDGFFGRILTPFGFSKKHSSQTGVVRPLGVSSGSSSTSSVNSNSSLTKPVGQSSSAGGTGISSGSHGGIGGGGSSAS